MSRSGYSEDGDYDNPSYLLWPSIVERTIKGRRGQAFLREMLETLDAMPGEAPHCRGAAGRQRGSLRYRQRRSQARRRHVEA